MTETEFLEKLNKECLEKGKKTNFQSIRHLAEYIVFAERFISPFRDD